MIHAVPKAERTLRELQHMLIKLDQVDAGRFSMTVAAIREGGLWRLLRDRAGKPYTSFAAFSEDRQPFGLGLRVRRLEFVVSQAISRQLATVTGELRDAEQQR
jgi:hypothetical protein